MKSKRTQRRWTFILSAVVVVALTGCSMYPTKAGDWPHNAWGSVLHWISDFLDFVARHIGNSYGFAIFILVLLVRLIILPLFIRQLRYQRVMMEMQPQIQKIRSKYKGDNQKIQQETMKLYSEAGTNPVMGCLPTLIQLPVLWALYGAIYGNADLPHSTFLGIFSLGRTQGFSVVHLILPVIAGLTTFLSSWLTMRNQPTQQRAILFVMPLVIIFMGVRFPGALVLYWIYTNLITAAQTYLFLTRPMAKEKAAKAASASLTPAKSSRENGSSSKGKSSGAPSKKTSSTKSQLSQSSQPSSKTSSKRPSGSGSAKTSSKKSKPKPSTGSGQTKKPENNPDGNATD